MENDYTKTKPYAITSLVIAGFSALVTLTLGIFTLITAQQINNTINSFNNNQEIVTLQPREGDVIIQENGNYKLLQLIKIEDIEYSTELQESRFSSTYNIEKRVDLFNVNNDDWTNRDSFGYTIEKVSINADKVMNLHGNIQSIIVYIDFYQSNDITTKVELDDNQKYKIIIFEQNTVNQSNTILNQQSNNTYVTNSFGNNGVNWAKLRIEISYKIDDLIFTSSILVDEWLTIKED